MFRWNLTLPLLMSLGMLFISLLTIFWCSCLMLNGSTMKGKVPVSMANMLTPLLTQAKREETNTFSRCMKWIVCLLFQTVLQRCTLLYTMKEQASSTNIHLFSLTWTRRPLWVHTSGELATQGPHRQDFHTGCSVAPETKIRPSECYSGQSLFETSAFYHRSPCTDVLHG